MVLSLELVNVRIKPIFEITMKGVQDVVRVLFDTGSTKVIWCST